MCLLVALSLLVMCSQIWAYVTRLTSALAHGGKKMGRKIFLMKSIFLLTWLIVFFYVGVWPSRFSFKFSLLIFKLNAISAQSLVFRLRLRLRYYFFPSGFFCRFAQQLPTIWIFVQHFHNFKYSLWRAFGWFFLVICHA